MRNITPIEAIQSTDTYKRLLAKKDNVKIYTLEKRTTRGDIANAVQIFHNTGKIPVHFTGIELQVIKDLCGFDNDKGTDYMNMFVTEPIILTPNKHE